jgi:hypothetical protein
MNITPRPTIKQLGKFVITEINHVLLDKYEPYIGAQSCFKGYVEILPKSPLNDVSEKIKYD